ncbi:MAG: recombinase family protein [Pirellulaceae bacterium]
MLLCLALFCSEVLSEVQSGPCKTPVDFEVPVGVSTTRCCRRRKSRTFGGAPTTSGVRAASYARFSSDMQRDESIADQQRKCREKAKTNGHTILRELEFSDEAISGTKRQRDGLNAMLAAAEAGEIDVLYFHSLSRLSRESVITLPLLKQLVYNCGVRVVSTSEGIDSNDTAWELIAHIMSIVHEQYLRDLAENVLRGQEGTVLAGFSVGDHYFGYSSQPIPESKQGRRGRNSKPRKMYIIDLSTAAWVARIFHWFVRERQSLRWIARELNRLGAPKDHRSTTKTWRHQYLPRLLRNRKYVGWWSWGEKKNVRDPLTGKIRQKDRAPGECDKWLRHLPHLQLIDDQTFAESQRLLELNEKTRGNSRKRKGQFRGSKTGSRHPSHLLSQLIRCGECECTFHVGGTGGKYLFCPGYAAGTCSCRTQLRRDRAERMIIDEIGRRILVDPSWRSQVLEETVKAWKAQEATIPTELSAARRNLADVEKKIVNLVDRIEGGRGGPELDERLAQRRVEKRTLTDRIQRLEHADLDRRPQPTESWVNDQLGNLGGMLVERTPAAAYALRSLVGGAIVVTEVRRPGCKRHFLQGRFTINCNSVVRQLVGATDGSQAPSKPAPRDDCEEIVIDFREPLQIESLSEKVKELYDQGMMMALIAERLGCSRSRATAALKFWFESRDLVMPDGRTRRGELKQKHIEPPLYQRISEQVIELFRVDTLLQDIADTLKVDRNTVTAAIRWWHEQRGIPVPDGRTRRKELQQKTSSKPNQPSAEAQAGASEDTSPSNTDEVA